MKSKSKLGRSQLLHLVSYYTFLTFESTSFFYRTSSFITNILHVTWRWYFSVHRPFVFGPKFFQTLMDFPHIFHYFGALHFSTLFLFIMLQTAPGKLPRINRLFGISLAPLPKMRTIISPPSLLLPSLSKPVWRALKWSAL